MFLFLFLFLIIKCFFRGWFYLNLPKNYYQVVATYNSFIKSLNRALSEKAMIEIEKKKQNRKSSDEEINSMKFEPYLVEQNLNALINYILLKECVLGTFPVGK